MPVLGSRLRCRAAQCAGTNAITRTVPVSQRFVQLWNGAPGYSDSFGKPAQLPTTYLLDKTGKIVGRYSGRIPAEAWDQISDLL